MKAHLMFPHDEFNIVEIPHIIKNTTYNDLELELISDTAARKDRVIYDSFSSALLHPVDRPEIVKYRQENIKDSIKNSEIIRNLYDIACDAVEKKRKSWWGFYRDTPSTLVLNSVTLLNGSCQPYMSLQQLITTLRLLLFPPLLFCTSEG